MVLIGKGGTSLIITMDENGEACAASIHEARLGDSSLATVEHAHGD